MVDTRKNENRNRILVARQIFNRAIGGSRIVAIEHRVSHGPDDSIYLNWTASKFDQLAEKEMAGRRAIRREIA